MPNVWNFFNLVCRDTIMYAKKMTLVSAFAAAAAFTALPAQASMSDMDWNLKVGDFYMAVEAGASMDKDVNGGLYDRVDGSAPDASVNVYGSKSNSNVGGRSAIGYKQGIDDMYSVSFEYGYGNYGQRQLSKGNNGSSVAANMAWPTIVLDYTGHDFMVGGHYVMNDGHSIMMDVGAQRTMVDLTQRGLADETANVNNPSFGTRLKAGVGYEYMLKDSVGFRANYHHVFGDKIDRYQAYLGGNDSVRNRANGVPKLDTVFLGLAMYF